MHKKIISFITRNPYLDYIVIMIISLHTLIWFRDGMLYFQGDAGIPYNPAKNLNMLYTWWERQGGFESWGLSQTFNIFFFVILEKSGISLVASQDLYIYFARVIAGFSMYYLASNFINNRLVCMLSALIYLFSPFLLGLIYFYVYLPYVFMPLIFGLYIKGLNNNSKPHIFLSAIVLVVFTCDFPNYRHYLVAIFLILLYSLFYIFTHLRIIKSSLIYTFKYLALVGITNLLLMLWIIIPIFWLIKNIGTNNLLLNIGVAFDDYGWATVRNIIRLRGSGTLECGTGAVYANSLVKNPIIIISSFYLPIIIFSLFLIRKKLNIYIYFLFTIAMLFLFISKGTNPPYGEIYRWIVIKVPLARAFRTSWLSILPVVIVYSVLGSLSISLIYNYLSNKRKICSYCFVVFSVFMILISSHPLVTGSYIQSVFSPTKSGGYLIPNSYYAMDAYLSEHTLTDSRLLKIPHSEGYMNTVHSWNYWGSNIIPFIFSEHSYIDSYILTNSASYALKHLYDKIDMYEFDNVLEKLLRIFNVKYLLVDGYEENYKFNLKVNDLKNKLSQNKRIIPEKYFDKIYLYKFNANAESVHIYACNYD